MNHCARIFCLLLLLTTALPATAQECSIGVFGDAAGDLSLLEVEEAVPFHVYVVLSTENVISAVSYELVVDGLNSHVFMVDESFGVDDAGFSIDTDNGSNVALGECAVGLGDQPILVADYTMILSRPPNWERVGVQANADEDPEVPIVNDCNSNLLPCPADEPLVLQGPPLAGEAVSFGEVKSLYR